MGDRDTGIVMKAGKGYAVVLTRDGRFLRVKSYGIPPVVGEEISFPGATEPRAFSVRLVAAFGLACLMVFVSFFGYTKYIEARPAVAYVSVDSSGSVELEVNDWGLVRAVRAFDEEGQRLLDEVRYRFRPVDEVIEEMAAVESSRGSSGFIVGITPIKETERTGMLENKIREKVQKAALAFGQSQAHPRSAGGDGQETANPMVNVFRFNMETRNRAANMSVSPGRLLVWGLAGKSQSGNKESSGETFETGQSGEDPERIRGSLPQVSDTDKFTKVLKEHDDEEKVKNVVDEMLKILEESEKGSKGRGSSGPAGNGRESQEPGKGNGSGDQEENAKGENDKGNGAGKGTGPGEGKDTGKDREGEGSPGRGHSGQGTTEGNAGKGQSGQTGEQGGRGKGETPGEQQPGSGESGKPPPAEREGKKKDPATVVR